MNKGEKEHIVCRFAPSPTGPLHVGCVRSALFNYLYARQNGGKLILRIEDTDIERSKKEYEDDIKESFAWLGLEFDETELGDFVIAKSTDEPLFHLAVVVDDFEMGITHVIRGEDHISNTPRQILIQDAIGAPRPIYAHIPLILAPDRSKLSKRKHGESVSLKYYRAQGYLPEALINYLALLGWNPGDDRELFSTEELIKEFSMERIQKGGAVFDIEKLNWMNKEYVTKLPKEVLSTYMLRAIDSVEQLSRLTDWKKERLIPVLADRIHYFGQVGELTHLGEFDYLTETPVYAKEALLWKKELDLTKTKTNIIALIALIEKLPKDATAEVAKAAIFPYAEEQWKGNVLWPLRMALSGKEKSIDPFSIVSVIGIPESVSRLNYALHLIE